MSNKTKLKPSAYIKTVTDDCNQEQLLGTGLCVVEFGADESGTMFIMAPVFEDLAAEFASLVEFFRVNCSANRSLCEKFAISIQPTYIFLKNAAVLNRIQGITSKNELRRWLVKTIGKG